MKTKILILAGLLCCMSSVICAQSVYVNSSPNATFSAYHTYAWGQQQNPNQVASSFLAQEAQNQINTQLQSKGAKMIKESENPDLIVVISGGNENPNLLQRLGHARDRRGHGRDHSGAERSRDFDRRYL